MAESQDQPSASTSSSTSGRLEETSANRRALLLRKNRNPEDSGDSSSDEGVEIKTKRFARYRTSSKRKTRDEEIKQEHTSRHILTNELFKEQPISLNTMNKVFCSQWLSDHQVIFGTKCHKLMVYDVETQELDQIPLLHGSQGNADKPVTAARAGIYSIQINPSRTLLSTSAHNSNEIAIYRFPTLDPVCVGETAHSDLVFDMCWLDDEFLVSGSRDSKMALWHIDSNLAEAPDKADVPTHRFITPVSVKECKSAQKVRALAFNKDANEIAALSLNSFIHIWCADTFKQKLSLKLPAGQENVCIAYQAEDKVYAVGCRSYTVLLDSKTVQPIKKIPSRYSGCGIRSVSFRGPILTMGTGLGMLMFYDIRAQKYLESSINSNRPVVLKASKGYVFPDEEYIDGFHNVKYTPAIYTHCYDQSGTRLFTAGGPLTINSTGNYAGLWQSSDEGTETSPPKKLKTSEEVPQSLEDQSDCLDKDPNIDHIDN